MEDDDGFASDNSYNVDNPDSPPPENVNPDEEAVEAPAPAATVEPKKKRIVRNPQPKLDADRLRGPRGLKILPEWFKDVRLKGTKGHEKEDLDAVMLRLEQWTHRLFPKFTFDDTLARIEKLGHKSLVSNYVKRIRLDILDEDIRDKDENNVQDADEPVNDEVDPFNALLNQHSNADSNDVVASQPQQSQSITLTDEQRERMIRNRLLAEERRLAREKLRAEQEQNAMSQVIS